MKAKVHKCNFKKWYYFTACGREWRFLLVEISWAKVTCKKCLNRPIGPKPE